jgi:DNA-binding IclR family transcriptional regulator
MAIKRNIMTLDRQDGPENKPKSIQSVKIGGRILDALIQGGGAMALKDIADKAQMSRSQAHRYLASFVHIGLVERAAEAGIYDLGQNALRLGLAAFSRMDAFNIVSKTLHEIVAQTKRTVLLTVWGDAGPTIVRWVNGRPAIATSLGLGSVLPVTQSSSGQVFASFLPDHVVRPMIEAEIERLPSLAETDFNAIFKSIRRDGYCTVADLVVPGLTASSFPVFNSEDDLAFVIIIVTKGNEPFPANREELEYVAAKVNDASAQLGSGYLGKGRA